MVTIDLDKLRKDLNISKVDSWHKLSDTETDTYCKIFVAIFKILQNNNFSQSEDGTTSKLRYLNNIQHFINNYSSSNKCSVDEKNLIKSNKIINQIIFDSLVEMKFIKATQTNIEFNQYEISNFHLSDGDNLLGKLNNLIIHTRIFSDLC